MMILPLRVGEENHHRRPASIETAVILAVPLVHDLPRDGMVGTANGDEAEFETRSTLAPLGEEEAGVATFTTPREDVVGGLGKHAIPTPGEDVVGAMGISAITTPGEDVVGVLDIHAVTVIPVPNMPSTLSGTEGGDRPNPRNGRGLLTMMSRSLGRKGVILLQCKSSFPRRERRRSRHYRPWMPRATTPTLKIR